MFLFTLSTVSAPHANTNAAQDNENNQAPYPGGAVGGTFDPIKTMGEWFKKGYGCIMLNSGSGYYGCTTAAGMSFPAEQCSLEECMKNCCETSHTPYF